MEKLLSMNSGVKFLNLIFRIFFKSFGKNRHFYLVWLIMKNEENNHIYFVTYVYILQKIYKYHLAN